MPAFVIGYNRPQVGHCDRSLFDEVVGICVRQARSKELCFADLVSIPILRHAFESCKCLIFDVVLEVLRKRGSSKGC